MSDGGKAKRARRGVAELRAEQGGRGFLSPRQAALTLLPLDPPAGVRWMRSRGLIHKIEIPADGEAPARVVELVYPPEVTAEVCRFRDRFPSIVAGVAHPPGPASTTASTTPSTTTPSTAPSTGGRPRRGDAGGIAPANGGGDGTVLPWVDPRKTGTG